MKNNLIGMRRFSMLALTAALVACGGGGGSDSGTSGGTTAGTSGAGTTAGTTGTTAGTTTPTTGSGSSTSGTTGSTGSTTRTSAPASTTSTTGVGAAAGGTSSGLAAQASGPSNGKTAVDWNSSAGATEAFSETRTLKKGGRYAQGFSLSGTASDMEIIFVAQTTANLYVMTSSAAAQSFVNSSSFSYSASLSFPTGSFGLKPLSSLPPGDYWIGVENTASVDNTFRVEVQQQPIVEGFSYAGDRFPTVVQNAAKGTRFVQNVTLGDTYRTMIDGANTGGSLYLIPGTEASNFLAGRTFQYISNNPCSSGTAGPGFCELRFPAGTYAIAYVNDTASAQAFMMYGRDFTPR